MDIVSFKTLPPKKLAPPMSDAKLGGGGREKSKVTPGRSQDRDRNERGIGTSRWASRRETRRRPGQNRQQNRVGGDPSLCPDLGGGGRWSQARVPELQRRPGPGGTGRLRAPQPASPSRPPGSLQQGTRSGRGLAWEGLRKEPAHTHPPVTHTPRR